MSTQSTTHRRPKPRSQANSSQPQHSLSNPTSQQPARQRQANRQARAARSPSSRRQQPRQARQRTPTLLTHLNGQPPSPQHRPTKPATPTRSTLNITPPNSNRTPHVKQQTRLPAHRSRHHSSHTEARNPIPRESTAPPTAESANLTVDSPQSAPTIGPSRPRIPPQCQYQTSRQSPTNTQRPHTDKQIP